MQRYALLLLFVPLLSGCWALLEGPAGDKTSRILRDYRSKVERPSVFPAREKETKDESRNETAPPPPGKVSCTLETAVELALKGNRDFIARKEDLHLQALSLAQARYAWDPQLSTTVSYLLEDERQGGARGASSGTLSGGVTQKLPWGGSVSLSGSSSAYQHHAAKQNRSASASLSASWNQPLLKGFGVDVALESMIQARRNLIVELRRFERYRQRFAIQTISRFFNLIRLADVVENSRRNFETLLQQYSQAEALFAVDRVPEMDLFRAEREMEQARNTLEEARDTFQAAKDDFKVYLGLSSSTEFAIVPPAWMKAAQKKKLTGEERPTRLPFPLSECIRAALANRLDLKNIEFAKEDAARAVQIAGNDLLPALDLTFHFGLDHDPVQDFEEMNFDASASAGLTFGIPWDSRAERDAFLKARIAEARAQRALELQKDQIRREVRDRYRSANLVRLTLYIQNKIRRSAEKRLKIAEFRFRRGEISNRDVMDAQEALLQAENRYIRALTDQWIRDLDLAESMGTLEVGSGGMPEGLGWGGPAEEAGGETEEDGGGEDDEEE